MATLAGVKQVVYLSADSLMGVERSAGKLLWRVPLVTNAKRHAGSPVIVGDTVTVNSHTFGTVCFNIVKDEKGFKAVEAWANKDLKTNLGTPAFIDEHLYNQGPGKDFICFTAKTGALNWSQAGFGLGKKDYSSTLVAGKNLLVLTEDGTLLLLAANPDKYTELGRAQVCGNTWSFPAYADGKFYVRDGRQLACYDLCGAN